MERQMIISVGREFGSGGHKAAEKLAQRLGLAFYDRNLLDKVAEERGMDPENLRRYDEGPRRHLFSRNVKGHVNSPEDHIAQIQFDYIREKAANGESFVIVGRCADTVLRGNPALLSFFVSAEWKFRLALASEVTGIPENEVGELVAAMDKRRKLYHNYHSQHKWGDTRAYDICLSSSCFGLDAIVDIMEHCVRVKFGG